MQSNGSTRRYFMKQMGVAAAAASVLRASSFSNVNGARRPSFKVGTIGVGSRGRGAMRNIRDAADLIGVSLEFVAVADVNKNAVKRVGDGFTIPEKHQFVGFDAYRKMLELPVDVVLMATPPNFRPLHFEAAVEANCHCFIEKPVAVDAPGARRMYAVGNEAARKGLTVVAGMQRRHMIEYLRNSKAIHQGAIGRILGGRVMWLWSPLWVRHRRDGESNADYLARNWGNFVEMSGDHIVEQHVHNLDIANWFIGHPPRSAIGFGGRARRETGNQYDYFSVNYDYGDHCNIHSMSRQINRTYGRQGESFSATEGWVDGGGGMGRFDGINVERPDVSVLSESGMVQEHVSLLQSILEEKGLNETKIVTDATLTAIMGRESAYSGQIVRWTDLTENTRSVWYNKTLTPVPEDFERGEVPLPVENVAPLPGQPQA